MIALEIVYQNNLVKVEQNKLFGYLQLMWFQQPNSKEFRKVVKKLTDYINKEKFNNVLSDVRQRLFLNISDQNWLHNEIFPNYNQIKDFKFAYLVNSTNLEMLDIYRIQEIIQSKPTVYNELELEIFLNKEEAMNWLLGYS